MTQTKQWWWLATAAGLIWLVAQLSPILMPFLAAILLAYLGDPLVDRLETVKLPRAVAVSLVFLLLFGLLTGMVLVLFPMLEQQISLLIKRIPEMIEWGKSTLLPWLQTRFAGQDWLEPDKISDMLKANWSSAGGLLSHVFGSITASGMAILAMLANLLLIPVVTFYLLRDWDHMVAAIHDLMPRKAAPKVGELAAEVDRVLAAFFKGQLLVMVSLALIYSVGLTLAGLELALLIGLLAGVVSFVPYLGLITGLLMAGVAALFQFGEPMALIWVALVFGIGQVLESAVLTPIFVGDRIGLHPVAVIFAVMAGGQLFGFTGVLLALPVAAVIVVFIRHFNELYKNSSVYSSP